MNKLGTWAVAAAIIAAVVNLVLFVLWFNLVRVDASMPESARGYTVEALALNVTILEIVIALVGFVLAILGFFGYVEIKTAAIIRAEQAAEKAATDIANEKMEKFIEQQARRSEETVTEGRYATRDNEQQNVTEATEGE